MMITYYCGECKKECEKRYSDDSFDHAFGTESCGHWESECCGADLFLDEDCTKPVDFIDLEDNRGSDYD